MAKIIALCLTLTALAVIAESKSIQTEEVPCYECAEERYERIKRDAPAILNSVSNLVNGILETNWMYIAKIRAQKLEAERRRTVIIGPGRNNDNRVVLHEEEDEYEYE